MPIKPARIPSSLFRPVFLDCPTTRHSWSTSQDPDRHIALLTTPDRLIVLSQTSLAERAAAVVLVVPTRAQLFGFQLAAERHASNQLLCRHRRSKIVPVFAC
ncbi:MULTISPECIES: hypothetical protein [unclassified Frankia]|uniref:hypothetical protein n=1 Tax=unclassified Frankia TaxID=2632575 RepID=UPI001EF49044|nr:MULTISPECIES: hypothetical protein [unclassified Frankia]